MRSKSTNTLTKPGQTGTQKITRERQHNKTGQMQRQKLHIANCNNSQKRQNDKTSHGL